MNQFNVEIDEECEITYQQNSITAGIKGIISAYYKKGEYITFRTRKDVVMIISLSHIVGIKYKNR